MSTLITRKYPTWTRIRRRVPYLIDHRSRELVPLGCGKNAGDSSAWWRNWARISTHGNAFLPRWSERGQ